MANVTVIGAGLGGLSTAMLLALDGHEVTVLERDPAGPSENADAAWDSWARRGVNQFRLPHFLLARWREILDRELPDVVAALDDSGCARWNPVLALPETRVGELREGDQRYESITGRRPAVESAIAAVAQRTYGVTIRRGVAVAGLLTDDRRQAGVPHVVGVRTDDGEDLRADLVVDSAGRRSPLVRWLADVGARPPIEEKEDSGFVYYGRHFRSTNGQVPRALDALLQAYDSVSILTLPADNSTWSVAFITSAADRDVAALRDPEVWSTALACYPLAAHWADGEPISGVDVMAKIEDRHRRLVVDGIPVATGIVAVADAWACTNPSLGRGATMGLMHACGLRDLLREIAPDEAYKLALRWDEITETTVGPFYRATLTFDRHRLGEIEAQRAGRPYETEDPTFAISRALAAAAQTDPDVLRAFLDIVELFALPEEVVSRPGMFERIIELGGDGSEPVLAPGGPSREELLGVVGAG